MPSNRKFYKTTVTVTVLSDEPLAIGTELEDIAIQTTHGGWDGEVDVGKSREITASQLVELLKSRGSSPVSFRLDAEGNDIG